MKKVFKHSAELRAQKAEASRRCRARQKALANGETISPDLALRALQPQAMKVENFKMTVGNKTVRLNRNGGEKVAMSIAESTAKGIVRTRKSFKNLTEAVKAFQTVIFG